PPYGGPGAGGARAGGAPADSVLPAAKAAARELAVVEAADVQVVSGQARIVVRFAAEGPEVATHIGRHVASTIAQLASVDSWRITERDGARWNPILANENLA
ncbi:MAG: hypothetical protein H7226_09785, partial [Salinibacterium sp.]|nr:hypothetical protein [Salinibacterium sp.]